MKKRGSLAITAIVIIVIISVLSIIVWQSIKIINKERADNQTSDIAEQENPGMVLAENITEETGISETGNINETSANEEEINAENIPNPAGSIIFISREDSSGGYFCNKTENPVHAVRIYAYKIINGAKNLSEDYIESSKIEACDDYNNESVTKGITYNIEWNWNAVDRIDGYKIYQYYLNKNISREYEDYIDIKTNKLLDTGLDLWQ
jgi:uncharacterized protein YpmB